MARLTDIWRHPIKALGVEPLERVDLTAGEILPGDRVWGVAHADARHEDGWMHCRNFIRGAGSPSLMAITAKTEADGRITLAHPQRGPLTVDPDSEATALVDWVAPLVNPDRSAPASVVRHANGLTDNAKPYISILNHASLRALSERVGQPLDPRRFRGNLWVEGDGPWQEFEWVGARLRIGAAEVEVTDRIDRCRAPDANPDTGRRDADILGALDAGWGHPDFGVFALVTKSGRITLGDTLEVL